MLISLGDFVQPRGFCEFVKPDPVFLNKEVRLLMLFKTRTSGLSNFIISEIHGLFLGSINI
jgi:hypothetical protein